MKNAIKSLRLKNHLLTAISYLIPVVCGAGFMIAIGMAMGGSSSANLQKAFSFWDALAVMGGAGLGMLPMIISTGIAYSIADKPGIAPGLVIGLAAQQIGAGFIGGLIGGFMAGWLVLGVLKYVKLPSWGQGLMPMLIVPFIASLIGSLIMIYIIGGPIGWLTTWLTHYLATLSNTSKLFYGLMIGVLASVDYGGPINKTVFAFVLTLQASGVNEPITALILVNMATPLGFTAAYFIGKLFRKNIYSKVEVETIKTAFPMGIFEIVEGVLPIVLNDIVRCVVATGIGGAVGGAISMYFSANSKVPFGGLLAIPTMTKPMGFIIGLIANILVTGTALALLKKPVVEKAEEEEDDTATEADLNMDDIQIS